MLARLPRLAHVAAYLGEELPRRTRRRLRRLWRIAARPGELGHRRRLARTVGAADPVLGARGWQRAVLPAELRARVVATCERMASARPARRIKGPSTVYRLVEPADYDPRGDLMQLALHPPLLEAVAAYLGTAPFINELELLYSMPTEGPAQRTQLWHRDKDDRRLIKLFLLVRATGLEHGPLTLASSQDSDRLPWHLPHYATDAEIAPWVGLERAWPFVGDAGDAIIADTRRLLHQGSRARASRLMLVIDYSTGFAFSERTRAHEAWHGVARGLRLSELQRLALGLR